jgi:hypothetical protein
LTFFAPTMFVPFGSVMKAAPGEASCLFAVLSIAYAKLRALTGEPSLKRRPLRMTNVYVLPRLERAKLCAASRTKRVPARSARSGQFTSFSAVAYSSHQAVVRYASCGSICTDAPVVP